MPLGCGRPAGARLALTHEAYVWQHDWSEEVAAAVVNAPPEIGALRVLARERQGARRAIISTAVDVAGLAGSGREVVAVLRIDGTASLADLSIDEVARIARDWQAQGVRVRGVEIDHDCATSALPGYAAWLAAARRELSGLTLSITALPTWATSPALLPLVATVDDVVVQLHTIAAPVLFEPGQARAYAESWWRATKRDFRVALPTYRARLVDGTPLVADPQVIAGFLAEMGRKPVPGLRGVVWFRLGHDADPGAWSGATLAAVVRGTPLRAQLAARLLDGPEGALDIVLENHGNLDGEAPAMLALSGQIEILDGVRGFVAQGSTLLAQRQPRLRPGERAVVGFVRGKDLQVAIR
jgi:hypothetical protein